MVTHGQPATSMQSEGPRRWRLTAEQYQRMGEAGILHEDDRVELIEGELYEMPPIGSGHNGSVNSLNWRFGARVGNRAIVQVQGSFRLSPGSEPEPDVLLLRFRPDFYRPALPGPEDVLLLVEVEESSLEYDRDVKLPLYAQAGIPEVWIVDRVHGWIDVYREPQGSAYRTIVRAARGDTIAALTLPDIIIPVEDVLG